MVLQLFLLGMPTETDKYRQLNGLRVCSAAHPMEPKNIPSHLKGNTSMQDLKDGEFDD